jgi:hypothetical protein
MQITVKTVTPEQATIWLKFATHKPLHRRKIRRFVRMLARGDKLPHGPAFCRDGHIFDGAEQLAAIAETGIAADLPVATGLPPIVQISRGCVRTRLRAGCTQPHRRTETHTGP